MNQKIEQTAEVVNDVRDVFSSVLNKAIYALNIASKHRSTRGFFIEERYLNQFYKFEDYLFEFQFNPSEISESKTTYYDARQYAGLPFEDYAWSNGGEKTISFQLFLDDTPSSSAAPIVMTQGLFQSRRHDRGILDKVEYLQSLLYPYQNSIEETPQFSSGGIVDTNQFRPPSVIIFCYGPIYQRCIVKEAGVHYSLFDNDLTPIRGEIDIRLSVLEYAEINKNDVVVKERKNSIDSQSRRFTL